VAVLVSFDMNEIGTVTKLKAEINYPHLTRQRFAEWRSSFGAINTSAVIGGVDSQA